MNVFKIYPNTYRDSVVLMKIATSIRHLKGIQNAEVILATEANKQILRLSSLYHPDMDQAGSADLIMSIVAESQDSLEHGIREAERQIWGVGQDYAATRLVDALNVQPQSNLALLSIPGRYVREEALKALDNGLNLMIFSDNVPLESEREIKLRAKELGLIVMGPDCGTAVVGGVALAFANKVNRGSIGIVGASGTGMQELMVLLHNAGLGISHAIGTGSNDIRDEIGALSMLAGIDMLEADESTQNIILVSKPPAEKTRQIVAKRLQACQKPVIALFLGAYENKVEEGGVLYTTTLEETALEAAAGIPHAAERIAPPIEMEQGGKGKLRFLYTGGTLAMEACLLLARAGFKTHSNVNCGGALPLEDPHKSFGDCVVDLGADDFTNGRPHPMIEPAMRGSRILDEGRDPSVAAIMLDFVLGYGASADPVGQTLVYIKEAQQIAAEEGRKLRIFAYVCGTDMDKQDKKSQNERLRACGVSTFDTNAQMVCAAIAYIGEDMR